MPYDPKAIANYFLDLAESAGTTIDPIKVQKLVYFAHGWHLAIRDEPLINEQVEAWDFGPVIRSLYDAFRYYGARPIMAHASKFFYDDSDGDVDAVDFMEPSIDDDPEGAAITKSFLDEIWETYGHYSSIQLSNITHEEGSPWHQVFSAYSGRLPRGTDIPEATIRAYFQSLA